MTSGEWFHLWERARDRFAWRSLSASLTPDVNEQRRYARLALRAQSRMLDAAGRSSQPGDLDRRAVAPSIVWGPALRRTFRGEA